MAVQEGAIHSYQEGTKLQDPFDGLQLDHIPSKQAIKEAYANVTGRDSVRDIDTKVAAKIDNITTIIVRANESHSQNDTTGARNKILSVVDSKVLALATVRDLEKYKMMELDRDVLSPQQIESAINDLHTRNIDLGIYSQREINIATEFAHEFANIDIRNNKEHIPTFEEIATRYDARLAETNTPKTFNEGHFNNRLAKPSIIVGATLASMVFTEEADASSIPTLHLSTDATKFDTLTTNEKLGAELGAGFNAINAIQAGEEFKAGASKSATTLLDTNAYKQGLEQATDAWKPSATKEVVKLGAMDSAKVAGKSFLKKLPLVGLVAGIGFGISRAMDGDWKGAGMEVASGAFSLVPGWGTAASVGMDAALLEKDTALLSHGAEKLLGKENQTLTQSEDNHTTIESNQNINLSNDLDQDALEQRVDPKNYQTINITEIEDKQSHIDTTEKAQDIIGNMFPQYQTNNNTHTQQNQKVEEAKEERSNSYETEVSHSPYMANDNITYSEEDNLPKNHRPMSIQNNLYQQPLEENQLRDEEQFRQAEQRIYDDIAEKYGSSNDYGNDRGMEID